MKPKFLILAIAIFVTFSAIALAEDCPNKCVGDVRYYYGHSSSGYCQYTTEDCDIYDKESGSRFCKNDDLYVQYKNYYCTPEGCKYTLYDQKVEELRRSL